ncbi:MAG TPA: hypothetical protein VJV23_13325, partial [Candidatus Polarisedimenticolia bacterium]|nr:hypothetical protein [Candidatus Polarisedimenticolia bacterium]
FAELAVQSLQESYGEELKQYFKQKGIIDLSAFLNALKKGGKQTLVEIDGEGESIKVWIE